MDAINATLCRFERILLVLGRKSVIPFATPFVCVSRDIHEMSSNKEINSIVDWLRINRKYVRCP